MTRIDIHDLPQDDELDREAMRSILGGGPAAAPSFPVNPAESSSGPVVEYPPGFRQRERRPARP